MACVGAVGWGTALQAGRSQVWFPMVSLDFFIDIFWPHCGPGADSASNRNEYEEYCLGGKGGRCIGLTTLPPSCANCHETWESQPPGTLKACPGIVLPFLLFIMLSSSSVRFLRSAQQYPIFQLYGEHNSSGVGNKYRNIFHKITFSQL
jgi:hypothetical protein